MNEGIKILWIIIGVIVFLGIFSSIGSYICGYYYGSKTISIVEDSGIQSIIGSLRKRIEQQADIIQSALSESDKIRADYKLARERLDNAKKTIDSITIKNNELASLNQAATKEIREARKLLETIGTSNITSTAIIIELKRINKEIADSINGE